MDTLTIYYDETGKTLTVWFDDPQKEFIVEETESEVLLIKDERGQVIGLERLNCSAIDPETLRVDLVRV